MNVLLGPTLSGKTTLMRLMAGLDRPTTGRLVEAGQDVTGLAVRKRSVAMVYQQFVNYPTLSVYENIASPLRVEGLAKAEVEARVSRAAKLLRLEPMLGRTPSQLSGGQQQRTAIARALVKQARLVLLDEPLANLDYKLREELREELPRIFAETGAILVYATTEPSEALLLRGRTATLSQGRVTQVGPTAELYRQPSNLDAARVFSDPPLNELAAVKAGISVVLGNGRRLAAESMLPGLPDGAYRIGFRSDAVSVGGAEHGLPTFPGVVAVTEINGSESFVHVDTGLGTWGVSRRGDPRVGSRAGPSTSSSIFGTPSCSRPPASGFSPRSACPASAGPRRPEGATPWPASPSTASAMLTVTANRRTRAATR